MVYYPMMLIMRCHEFNLKNHNKLRGWQKYSLFKFNLQSQMGIFLKFTWIPFFTKKAVKFLKLVVIGAPTLKHITSSTFMWILYIQSKSINRFTSIFVSLELLPSFLILDSSSLKIFIQRQLWAVNQFQNTHQIWEVPESVLQEAVNIEFSKVEH